MDSIRRRTLFNFLVLLFVITISMFRISNTMFVSFVLFLSFSVIFFFIASKRLSQLIKIEESAYLKDSFDQSDKICIITACKNEGDTIIKNIQHYMSFSENVYFWVYDDGSSDGSCEKIRELVKQYNGRLALKSLKKRDIAIHPKAFAMEDAFTTDKFDFFLIIDADSVISKEDFEKAVISMKNKNLDILHISRRNKLSNCFTNRLGDIEELLITGLRTLNLQTSLFEGSGIFIKSDIVRDFKFEDNSYNEDNYFYNEMKQKTEKIDFFLTLQSFERAPLNLKGFLKQKFNWFKMGVPFFLKYNYSQLFIWNLIASITVISVLNPLSMGLLIVAVCSGVIMGMELALSLCVTKENPIKVAFYTLCYLLIAEYLILGIFLAVQILILFNKLDYKIEKNN